MMSVSNVRFRGGHCVDDPEDATHAEGAHDGSHGAHVDAGSELQQDADVGAGDDGEVEYVPGVVEVHVAEGEQLGDALHGEDEGEDPWLMFQYYRCYSED